MKMHGISLIMLNKTKFAYKKQFYGYQADHITISVKISTRHENRWLRIFHESLLLKGPNHP